RVTTVEGLRANGTLHRLQQAFVDEGAVQCGFCTPGMLLAGAALLAETPHPTEEDVREALVGNLCRCTGYARIVRAVLAAAGRAGGGAPWPCRPSSTGSPRRSRRRSGSCVTAVTRPG